MIALSTILCVLSMLAICAVGGALLHRAGFYGRSAQQLIESGDCESSEA